MSLWALVMICSLVTAMPVVGNDLLELLWGGSVVPGVTVNRCFGIHFIVPIVLLVVLMGHLLVLHLVNSTGESGMAIGSGMVLGRSDRVNF